MVSRALVAALALAAGAAAPAAAQQPMAAGELRVQLGVRVVPETVTVGQPFRVIVRVRAPQGTEIEFPEGPDTASTVQALGPARIAPGTDPSVAERTAVYPVAAWDVERQPVVLGDLVLRTGDTERRVTVTGAAVYVRSVLPADSAKRIPKPARAILDPFVIPWWWWALAAAVVLALLLAWWLWRRRKRGAQEAGVDPYDQAEQDFARIDRLGLVDAGERARHVALMVEVLRDYLAARVPAASRAHTSGELLMALAQTRTVPAERLARVLRETDLIKFARFPVSAERATALGNESRGIVREAEAQLRAEAAAHAAAEQAAAARKPREAA